MPDDQAAPNSTLATLAAHPSAFLILTALLLAPMVSHSTRESLNCTALQHFSTWFMDTAHSNEPSIEIHKLYTPKLDETSACRYGTPATPLRKIDEEEPEADRGNCGSHETATGLKAHRGTVLILCSAKQDFSLPLAHWIGLDLGEASGAFEPLPKAEKDRIVQQLCSPQSKHVKK